MIDSPVPNLRIVLVEDHDLFRVGVRSILTSSPRFEVLGETRTARDAFPVIESVRPDVVLMDLDLPGMDGVVATREILRRVRSTHVVILSAHDQLHDLRDAMDAGALGYVVKGDEPEILMQAIEEVARGVRYLSPSVAGRLSEGHASWAPDDVLEVLSEREREIFRLAADCRTAAEICEQLCIARKTVDTHLNRINRKLGLRARAALA